MTKRSIFAAIVLLIACIAIFLPYKNFTFVGFGGVNTPDQNATLLQDISGIFSDFRWETLGFLAIFIPLLFAVEAFFFKAPFSGKVRILMLIQCAALLFGAYYSDFAMSFDLLEADVIILPPFYIILVFEGLFALWTLLVAIPGVSKLKIINFPFE